MRNGFTLIELLIVIAILAIVSTAGFIGLSRYKGGRDVELTMSEVVSVIRDVQKRSITEQSGKQWGIRFGNATSSYETFSGSSYSTSTVDKTYYLSRNILFGNPATSTIDAIFSAISGKLSENRIISLINKRRDGLVGDITLTLRGTITSWLEHGVVGYWHLDEATSTSAYDSSGFTNTGTLTNGPTWQSASSCGAGTCLNFDGTDDYVNVASPSGVPTGAETWLLWFNPDINLNSSMTPNYQIFLSEFGSSNNREQFFYEKSTGRLRWNLFTGTETSYVNYTTTFTAGTWYHFAVTYDGATNKMFMNGSEVASSSQAHTDPTSPSWKVATDGASNYFDGRIDEVRIYNRALSDTEIQNLYNDLK